VAAASGRRREITPGERQAVTQQLAAHRWNRVEAARALGMSRSTLWRRMRDLGLG
jgi:transcriptional regulator of acetoin/glycerol metabolism